MLSDILEILELLEIYTPKKELPVPKEPWPFVEDYISFMYMNFGQAFIDFIFGFKVIVFLVMLLFGLFLGAYAWNEGDIFYPLEDFDADDIDENTEHIFTEEEREEHEYELPLDAGESYNLNLCYGELLWEEEAEQENVELLDPDFEYELFWHFEGELYGGKYEFDRKRYYLFEREYWEKTNAYEEKRDNIYMKYRKRFSKKYKKIFKEKEIEQEINKRSKFKKMINYLKKKKIKEN